MKQIKLILTSFFIFASAACAKEPSLVGTWEMEMIGAPNSSFMVLKPNGDLLIKSPLFTDPVEFKWSQEGNKLVMSVPDKPNEKTVYVIESLSTDKLTLVSSPQKGPPTTYKRVEDAKD